MVTHGDSIYFKSNFWITLKLLKDFLVPCLNKDSFLAAFLFLFVVSIHLKLNLQYHLLLMYYFLDYYWYSYFNILFFPNNTEYCWGTVLYTSFFSFCVIHCYTKKRIKPFFSATPLLWSWKIKEVVKLKLSISFKHLNYGNFWCYFWIRKVSSYQVLIILFASLSLLSNLNFFGLKNVPSSTLKFGWSKRELTTIFRHSLV